MANAVAQVDVPPGKGDSDVQSLITDGRRLLQEKKYQEALQRFESTLARDGKNAEALFYAGSIYMILGRTQQGLTYIERSVALAPKNPRLLFILAKAYETLSMNDKAIDAFRKVQAMASETPEAKEAGDHIHILLGKKYGEQGKFEQALQEFDAVLAHSPKDFAALMNKGLTLSFMGKLNDAQTVLEKAVSIQPNNPVVRKYLADVFEKKDDLNASRKQYEKLLRLVPKGSPPAKLAEMKLAIIDGADLLAEKHFKEAQAKFEEALAIDPNDPIARLNMAKVYHGLGDMAHAEKILNSLVEDNPNNLDARLRLGALYLELGRLGRAVHNFEEVIARGKSTVQAKQAAELLNKIGSLDKSKLAQVLSVNDRIALYKATLKQNPDDRQAWLDLGFLYLQVKRNDDAIKAFENVVRLNANDSRALAILGGLYQDGGKYDKAIQSYKKAMDIEKNPAQKRNIEEQLNLAQAKKDYYDKKLQEAEKGFKSVIAEDKNNYTAHFFLGLIYSQKGELEQAIPEYQQVITIVPGHLSARLNLAIAYEQIGRDEDAVVQYETVVRAGVPQLSPAAKQRLEALQKRIGGISYSVGYSLNFDSNTNLSPVNPVQELSSALSGTVMYRHKINRKKVYWGVRANPTYSVYHKQQFDFLKMEINPFVSTTWLGLDISANYSYSQTDSVVTKKNYNKTNSFYADATKRFRMRSLLPWLTAKEQRGATPSVWRVNSQYQTFKSATSPTYDSSTYTLGLLLSQAGGSGWTWTGNYTYINNHNLKSIGNDFAYTGHSFNFQLSKSITPKLDANGAYNFTYDAYKHPDSVTKFTKPRTNKLQSLSAGLNYAVNNTLKLYCNVIYQRNNSNLPTGFILSSEDASTLIGVQSPSLGDYRRYSISTGMTLNF